MKLGGSFNLREDLEHLRANAPKTMFSPSFETSFNNKMMTKKNLR